MSVNRLSLSAGIGALALAVCLAIPAGAETGPHSAAIEACTTADESTPRQLVTAIDDGRGGSFVWLTDSDLNLWLCNADAEGRVYALSLIFGDMLEGAGASLVERFFAFGKDDVPFPEPNPLIVAEQACQAYLGEPGTVVLSGLDGLAETWIPGYFVFIETGAGKTFLCNATADARVWVFAEIGDPLTFATALG